MVSINARLLALTLGIGAAVTRQRNPSKDALFTWAPDHTQSKHAKARAARAAAKRGKKP